MIHSLDRLTDRERDLLTLLAQGHTAKTIAKLRSLSANAVNEQLRSARRKTAASSSRELARLLVGEGPAASPIIRDDLFGVERPSASGHRKAPRGASLRRSLTSIDWRLMMSPAVLLAAAALAVQTSTPAEPKQAASGDDPASASAPARSPDIVYQVFFLSDGELLSAPTVAGRFGREVQVEIPRLMRVILFTGERDPDGRFLTSAEMQLFRNDAWETVKRMSMRADLAMTPSFEHSVENTPYRFVVHPRLIVPAAGGGD